MWLSPENLSSQQGRHEDLKFKSNLNYKVKACFKKEGLFINLKQNILFIRKIIKKNPTNQPTNQPTYNLRIHNSKTGMKINSFLRKDHRRHLNEKNRLCNRHIENIKHQIIINMV